MHFFYIVTKYISNGLPAKKRHTDINSKYVFFLTITFTEGFTAQRIQGEQKNHIIVQVGEFSKNT